MRVDDGYVLLESQVQQLVQAMAVFDVQTAGNLSVPQEDVQIVQSVIDSLSPVAKESGVDIERTFGDEPVEARGDRDELFQVFENLLENACKYGQSGGRVVVSIDKGNAPDPEVAVTIRDFGPGIPEEQRALLFTPFGRLKEVGQDSPGLGLGLYISRQLAELQGGQLRLEPADGRGTAFTFSLPLISRPGRKATDQELASRLADSELTVRASHWE